MDCSGNLSLVSPNAMVNGENVSFVARFEFSELIEAKTISDVNDNLGLSDFMRHSH